MPVAKNGAVSLNGFPLSATIMTVVSESVTYQYAVWKYFFLRADEFEQDEKKKSGDIKFQAKCLSHGITRSMK